MRSKIVNRANLNQLARKMGFDQLIVFDQKTVNAQTKHHSMLGDAFEALIGAIYLDKGYNFTKEFLLKRIVKPYIDIHTLELTETNFKSKLIEWCQRHGKDITFDMIANARRRKPQTLYHSGSDRWRDLWYRQGLQQEKCRKDGCRKNLRKSFHLIIVQVFFIFFRRIPDVFDGVIFCPLLYLFIVRAVV